MTTSQDILALSERLARAGYIADRPLVTTLLLMEGLDRPLLLEGDAGVGKTALAQAYAAAHDTRVIRLQCYEGLDVGQAVYEWNYAHQLLAMKLQEQSDRSVAQTEAEIFSERFLLPRPLLKAITQDKPPVLLIDEIDRADEQFEAYLLELLSDWQVSIPELGTIRARSIPHVMLTSNATRELSDALRRRCLYYFLDYPGVEKELRIVENRLPGINAHLARQVVKFVHGVRALDLRKRPGVAETLDWAAALMALEIPALPENADRIIDTLGCLMKTQEDRQRLDSATLRGLLFTAAG
ncbi:MAG: hypothetical protein NFCOHLIN_02497 [Gammaproteobacteria bacterium]|nr:hypothetical protein [Gammaproteobacteria bacterium]